MLASTKNPRGEGMKKGMKNGVLGALLLAVAPVPAWAAGDTRERVELPAPMQEHMLGNMRDHLAALDEILLHLGNEAFDRAAEVAESRLGISSMERHGAAHMAPFMPPGMRHAGTAMHKAASLFAVVAREGDALHAYLALRDVTAACVTCHSGYRIR